MEDVLPTGTRLGRYEIVTRLALGGMAEIYLARITGLAGFAKHVVLKRILPAYAKDAEFVRMFFNEARYAATLDHPNIAHVYDLGEEDGLHYFTMEYLHGDDCRAFLRELAAQRQRLPLEHALTIVVNAAAGCHFAHELTDADGDPLGLVHRDVSPSNVVITYAGAVKLVDFGIAKATRREDATAVGVTKGKLAYMAPEQCKGAPLDRRVDVYGLGVLLYELTTQRRAFVGANDAAVMWQVVSGEVPWPSQVMADYPPDLDAIVRRAMHFEREQRYPSARELQHALETFARDHGLALGATALAEYFEATMGPKVEPWRESGRAERLARASTQDTPRPAPVVEAPVVAVAGPASAISDAPTLVPMGTPSPSATGSLAPSVRATAPEPPVTAARWPWIIAGAVVLSASGVVAIVLTTHRARPAADAAPVTMVAERGTATVELDGGSSTSLVAAAAREAAPVAAASADAASVDAASVDVRPVDAGPVTRKPATPSVAGGAADPLSNAFRRDLPAVQTCFEAHVASGQGAPRLQLRFEIDTRGVPTQVAVLPADLAGTALGACVVAVGKKSRFPAQTAPAAFKIPLSVRP